METTEFAALVEAASKIIGSVGKNEAVREAAETFLINAFEDYGGANVEPGEEDEPADGE